MDRDEKLIRFSVIEFLKLIVGSLALGVLLSLIIVPSKVVGDSMENTMHDGEYYIVEKVSYMIGEPSYKDIVVIKEDKKENMPSIVKRVIGVEGDLVEIVDNVLYVNGKELNEPYIPEPMLYNEPISITVPKDEMFVLGDNRNISLDSRKYGTIPVKRVIGRVMTSK